MYAQWAVATNAAIDASGTESQDRPAGAAQKLNFSPPQRREALAALRDRFGQCEAVLLSTCNRVELYLVRQTHGHPPHIGVGRIPRRRPRRESRGIAIELIRKKRARRGEPLFSVASSLDSMVLGETQIVGQVREAYETAALPAPPGRCSIRCFSGHRPWPGRS